MNEVMRREVRVALSKKAQPAWFRIAKWLVFLAGSWIFYSLGYFWYWFFGLLSLSLGMHMFFRWKTAGWTRPWGPWNDVEAGK